MDFACRVRDVVIYACHTCGATLSVPIPSEKT
jgi:hypothetical protein